MAKRFRPSLYVILWGGLGTVWMAWLFHIRSLHRVMLTDCVGLWSANYLQQFRGIAPLGDLLLFNAWMVATSAGEWIVFFGLILRYLKRRFSK
jgi:hypothetical protein